tara:strand:+ start:1091 stop:2482 length:1392 start_codon:yes stop_codon:yes gene_type:complete
LFFCAALSLYWLVFNVSYKAQNLIVLISSCTFYSFWDYRFLSLLFISIVVDYFIGLKLNKSIKPNKLLLYLSCFFNLGILAFFKYFNFFIDSWIELFQSVGFSFRNNWSLKIILPVGISFYTFQTMSYTIDIYRGKIKPTTDFIAFASFVTFFPQLVAGPIERASSLLPQILRKRKFSTEQATEGFRLILWGLFKKVVVADNLSPFVDSIFSNYTEFGGGTLALGALYFSFQIYCDFSGYSDIAIGISKLLGIELMSNFKFPYFSRNIAEFWRRWHISLSSWFRDYLYFPLGGSRGSRMKSIRNVTSIFLISGLWHGANWTFVFWGFIHALLYIPLFITGKHRNFNDKIVAHNTLLPSLKEFIQIIITFFFVLIGWIFFRSETIYDAFQYLNIMFFQFDLTFVWIRGLPILFMFLVLDWSQRKDERKLLNHNLVLRWFFYLFLSLLIFLNFGKTSVDFIYFQF